jgi:TolB protein
MITLTLIAVFTAPAQPADWATAESKYLKNIKQITAGYARAGEGYFSPDAKTIIFQAEEKDTGNPFYQMFVQDLATGVARRISPGMGRCTCGYFRPDGKRIIYASSFTDPNVKATQDAELKQRDEDAKAGRRRRYQWDFDPCVKIYESDIDGENRKCLTPNATVYTAEASFSADGKFIVYSAGNEGNVQLFIMNADGSGARQLTTAKNCYNGGPFFSPDGKRVIFRSDRKEKDRLQLYVINSDGTGETALTDDANWVYWAPYWANDGTHIVYTAADHSDPKARPNYDVYWMNIATKKTTRITQAPGQDVLPVLSPDQSKLMWTSNRDGRIPTQLFLADFTRPD